MRDATGYFASIACALSLLFLAPVASRAQDMTDADTREIVAYQLTEAVAKLDAVPGAKAAVQSAGMMTREYVVFTFSLIHNGLAAWALDQPGGKLPPGVSQSNVDFFRNHAAEMEKLGEESDDETCGDGGEDENGE